MDTTTRAVLLSVSSAIFPGDNKYILKFSYALILRLLKLLCRHVTLCIIDSPTHSS